MILKIIAITIGIGLMYLGSVQVYRFIQRCYQKSVIFYSNLKTTFKMVQSGKEFTEVKKRKPAMLEGTIPVTATEPAISITAPKVEAMPNDAELIAEVAAEEEPENIPDEILFIAIDVQGKEYNSSDDIGSNELVAMSHILSGSKATIADEIATARTLYKLKDSPLMDEMNAIVGKRIRKLFDNVMEHAQKIDKTGDFDYSQYIKK